MESSIPGGKRKRAQKACQFCLQRKMKCNNEVPKCSNRLTHGQVCTYAQGPGRPRPSNDRISLLEEENRQLHACLDGGSRSDDHQAQRGVRTTRSSFRITSTNGSANPVAQSSQPDDGLTDKEHRSLSPARVTAPKSDKFHGPSSLLFDEDAPSIGPNKDVNNGGHPLGPPSSKLVAEAATRRTCSFAVLESPVLFSTTLLTCLLRFRPTRDNPFLDTSAGH